MSSVNTDLNRFAVFINSKAAVYPSTTKSDVVIPFAANLANHDPLKTMKISIVDVLFSNVFYNIRPNVNKLKWVDVFAAGRGCAATYQVGEATMEYGYYNYDTFTDFADANMGEDVTVAFGGVGTTQVEFLGFGSKYAGVTSNNITASSYSMTFAKVWMQTPSLGDMFQPFPNDATVTSPDGISYIYAGKYLIVDDETYGLMHLLGFAQSDNYPPPPIPGTPYIGYGVPIYNRLNGGNTEYSFDNVTWGSSTADTTIATVVPQTVSDFTGLDDLYIHCEQLRTQFLSGISKAPLAPNDVVCVVPINVGFGEKMSFIPQFPLETYLVNTNVTQLHFRMTNSNNQELDFKGINWSITMFCEEVDDTARIEAEKGPIGNLPQTFFTNGQFMEGGAGYLQNRLNQAKRKM
jgi:hypothetical protein